MNIDFANNWIDAIEGELQGNPLNRKSEDVVVDLLELIADNPDDAFEVILQIIKQSPSERILNRLGAGPIEDLLVKHPEYLEKLINVVPDSIALKSCLTHVNADEGSELEKKLIAYESSR